VTAVSGVVLVLAVAAAILISVVKLATCVRPLVERRQQRRPHERRWMCAGSWATAGDDSGSYGANKTSALNKVLVPSASLSIRSKYSVFV
jgi:hypothetical protein